MDAGEAVVILGLSLWLTIAVGPWWLLLVIYGLGWAANRFRRLRAGPVAR